MCRVVLSAEHQQKVEQFPALMEVVVSQQEADNQQLTQK